MQSKRMSNPILLFFIVSFFFLCPASSSPSYVNTTYKCSLQQTRDLLTFKQNLSSINFSIDDTRYSPCEDWLGSGYNPIMSNWNLTTDCCDWNGVTCDRYTGDVIGLDLSCGMLQGTIHPNTTLFHLPRLERLNIAYNSFIDSQLPPDIDKLSNSLTHLNISFCGFTGQVPTNISHIHKLVSLDLSWNMNGNLIGLNLEPHVFINLLQNSTVIKELSLDCIDISSELPTNLNISSSLRLLRLYYTRLQGNIPHNIFNLQSLEKLDLSGNSFTGHIPSEITHLPNLVSLDLSLNGIDNLQIQPHIFSILIINSTCLRDLRLYEVKIGFVLPSYLNISSSLRSLGLSFTKLQGKLPDNFLNLKYLEELHLSGNNNLSGPFPKINTSTKTPLRALAMSSISLSGEIPTSICHLNFLLSLSISYSGLNGTLPNSIGNLTCLVSLRLSSNMLFGTLPSSLFTLPAIKKIWLENNMFQGNVPLELFSLPFLKELSLANNHLTGQIDVLDSGPSQQTFQGLTKLTYLDLSYNKIRGEWELDTLLSSLTNLETLILSHSGISVMTNNANHYVNPHFGTLNLAFCSLNVFPVSIRAMTGLIHLDLSSNDIHGGIPEWLEEIGRNLVVFNISNNSISGTIPNVYEDWGELQGFILNGNQLEGKVPTSLYKCKNLRIIDLGNNFLNDTFPGWLGDIPKLVALVLKSNNFHSGIATSSMVKFPFPSLRILDLSHNWFEGQLPRKYFQIFNALRNVTKSKAEYVLIDSMYYSITIVMKGVVQHVLQLLVEYTIVDLSNNKFEGDIPNIIGNLDSLKVLNLSHNCLTGGIPHALGKISEIESLDLSWNQLAGGIPQSLAELTFLGFLNLSQNHLVGRIPQGKQFSTFSGNSFGGNPKLCGLPLSNKCSEHLQEGQLDGDGDVYEYDEGSGFIWKVVMIGYECGTLLGFVLGYLMLSYRKPKWFNAIVDEASHMIMKRKNKRRY
ncbi:receptor-like protein Cf-9 [Bidens hawaiensis]|uniref:receptor-like protein Cf-9 n=1 Tax=Bidens hawaiensis TaxID=980011 RepID=UPI00404A86DB